VNGGGASICGSAPVYRRTQSAYGVTAGQVSNWVLTPVTSEKVIAEAGQIESETVYEYDEYGRMTLKRGRYAPGSVSDHDLQVTLGYDPLTSNRNSVLNRIPIDGIDLGETTSSWYGGFATRTQSSGMSWYSLDMDREPNWGLPTAVRRPDGDGVSILYDNLGRPTTIRPLASSPDPPVDIKYETDPIPGISPPLFKISTSIGDASAQASIQRKRFLDGFGRVREEQMLKLDSVGGNQWVSKKYTRDALGSILSESEWAPVGTTGPVSTIARSGTYDASGNVYVDPFLRIRKTVGADGATALKSYKGLVTTTTVQGIQGGTASAPIPFNSVTTETTDIFGRLVRSTTKQEGEMNPEDRIVEYDYDVLDRRRETRTIDPNDLSHPQVKSVKYDPLGRVKILTEPERGRIWFGKVTLGGLDVDADGYDALGNVVRYEDEFGYSSVPAYHYRKTYDAAGRLTLIKKVEDVSQSQAVIADYLYDDSDHGIAASQNGQLCRARGYDSASPPALAAQTDYYYRGEHP